MWSGCDDNGIKQVVPNPIVEPVEMTNVMVVDATAQLYFKSKNLVKMGISPQYTYIARHYTTIMQPSTLPLCRLLHYYYAADLLLSSTEPGNLEQQG